MSNICVNANYGPIEYSMTLTAWARVQFITIPGDPAYDVPEYIKGFWYSASIPYQSVQVDFEFRTADGGAGVTLHQARWRITSSLGSGVEYGTWTTIGSEADGVGSSGSTLSGTFVMSTSIECALAAERTGNGNPNDIWRGHPGNGIELCAITDIKYRALVKSWTGTFEGEGFSHTGGNTIVGLPELNYNSSTQTYYPGATAYGKIETKSDGSGSYATNLNWTGSISASWSGGSGSAGASRTETRTRTWSGPPTGSFDTTIDYGGGGLTIAVAPNSTIASSYYYGDGVEVAYASISDYCNAVAVSADVDLGYMWDSDGSDFASTAIIGTDKTYSYTARPDVGGQMQGHTVVETLIDISGGGPFEYSGGYTLLSSIGTDQCGENVYSHGGFYLARQHEGGTTWVSALHPVWDTDHFDESALGQPAHPSWLPLPAQRNGSDVDPVTGEPVYVDGIGALDDDPQYYDHSLYVGSNSLTISDLLQITVPAAGSTYATPLTWTDITLADWTLVNCTASHTSGKLRIVPSSANATATLSAEDGLALNKRLGGRYAIINWYSSVAGAKIKVQLGPHTWELTAGDANALNASVIDLLRPDTTTSPVADCQSIIPYELPHNTAPGSTDTPTYEFPSGWGVGRITSIVITCENASATIDLSTVQLKRAATVDGGFCRLYVLPHQSPWPDSRDPDAEPSLYYGGTAYNSSATTEESKVYEYIKALLIIDGAVALEIASGNLEVYSTQFEGDQYVYHEYHLFARNATADPSPYDGAHPLSSTHWDDDLRCCRPADDYTASAVDWEITAPGITVAINRTNVDFPNEFRVANALVAWLKPGVYEPVANVISVDWQALPNSISHGWGLDPSTFWDLVYGRWGGAFYGCAWTEAGVIASNARLNYTETKRTVADHGTLETVSHSETTDRQGFFISDYLKTRYDTTVGTTETAITLRNRWLRRIIGTAIKTSGAMDIKIDQLTGIGHIAYATADNKLYTRRTTNHGLTFEAPVLITDQGAPAHPCLSIDLAHPLRLWSVVYNDGNTVKRAKSPAGFGSLEVSTVVSGLTHVRERVHPVNGIRLLAGWRTSDSSIVVSRSYDNGATYDTAFVVAAAPEQGFGLDISPTMMNIWVITFADSNGDVQVYWSSDDGRTWAQPA